MNTVLFVSVLVASARALAFFFFEEDTGTSNALKIFKFCFSCFSAAFFRVTFFFEILIPKNRRMQLWMEIDLGN